MKTLAESAVISSNGVAKKPVVDNKVLSTRDYAIFKKIIGNRELDISHVNKIKESMKDHDLMIPIIVNEKLEIIDGQHRLQARKELGITVHYVVIKGLTITDTQKANLNNKNWTSADFLNFYVKQNFYHYKLLKEFIKKFKFSIQVSTALLGGYSQDASDFRSGLFNVINLEKSENIAQKVYELQPYYKGFNRRSFVYAMMNVLNNENFDFDEFINKVSYQSSKLVHCTNVEQYLELIEDIYNYKRKTEDKVRFRK